MPAPYLWMDYLKDHPVYAILYMVLFCVTLLNLIHILAHYIQLKKMERNYTRYIGIVFKS